MKLLAVALALIAVAFAAPRVTVDTVVPEEAVLVQSSTTAADVEGLKKQFQELQMQLQDGATPGVINVINQMIAMIETEIEVAIEDAHKSDQDTVNSKMQSIADLNGVYTDAVSNLNERATNIEGLISNTIALSATWKDLSEKFTTVQNAYMGVYGEQTDTCCKKDNAGVVDVEYTPAYALCDYTVPAGAKCGERAVKAASDVITDPFTKGLALYRQLDTACNGLIVDLDAADVATDSAIGQCQSAKDNTKSAERITRDEKATWSTDWDRTIAHYNGNYTAMMADYDATKTRVVSDMADRKTEHQATQEIKCMLKAYRDGGSFDAATRASCSQGIDAAPLFNIDFPAVVPQLSWDKHVFTEFTNAADYEHTCDARTPAPVFTCVVPAPEPWPKCSISAGTHTIA